MKPKTYKHLLLELNDEVLTVTLNRPELHNAFNEEMIAEITQVFLNLAKDPKVRVVVLTGAGESFCAGADLNWMKQMAAYTKAQNLADAKRLNRMFLTVYRCPKPVIAVINGGTLGGGTGLVSCVDIALAEEKSFFAFSEVRLGLMPAVISPYVVRKIGESNAREYFLTAERFPAKRAYEMGLINFYGSSQLVQEKLSEKIKMLKQGAPGALAGSKKLIEKLKGLSLDKAEALTTPIIAERRSSKEGQEGMVAFLTKRKPNWLS